MARQKVGEILIQAGLIDEMQLRAALGDQSNWGQRLGVTLVKMGVVTESELVRALAQQLQLPVVTLEGKRVHPDVLELVPLEFADKHMCVPLFLKEQGGVKTLYVGMQDPCDLDAIDELGFRTGLKVQPVMVSPSELCEGIDRLYRRNDRGSGVDVGVDSQRRRQGVEHVPVVDESLFPNLHELELGEADVPVVSDPEPQPQADAVALAPVDGTEEANNRNVLRALCHLLIEKKVISREELQSLVRTLSSDIPLG